MNAVLFACLAIFIIGVGRNVRWWLATKLTAALCLVVGLLSLKLVSLAEAALWVFGLSLMVLIANIVVSNAADAQ